MTSIDFIFGNIDKQGKLASDDTLTSELKTLLSSHDTASYLNQVLSTPLVSLAQPTDILDEETIKPVESALDYTDITELAEDIAPKPMASEPFFFKEMEVRPVVKREMKVLEGRLKFSEIFASSVITAPKVYRSRGLNVNNISEGVERVDDVELFMRPMGARKGAVEESVAVVPERVDEVKVEREEVDVDIAMSSVMLEHWEEKIVWDPQDRVEEKSTIRMFRNEHLDDMDWTDSITWDSTPATQPLFHMDDPTLLILQEEVDKVLHGPSLGEKGALDRFNISEDWKNEVKELQLIKQTHGQVKLMHSLPAIKLHPTYFNPILPVKEMRSHHRIQLKFPLNESIPFTRVRSSKKKKFGEIDPGEMMRTPKDITLKDTSRYILVEYSEEYPPVMQNIGMASLVYNYYRKKDEKDNYVPKLDNGGAYILEAVDVSPFYDFGDVKKGQTTQVLYNNIFRAPLFRQAENGTDFLVVRQSYKGVVKYYLRDVGNLYVAGQLFPSMEVPRPQARRITQALKSRLQVVGYRLMRLDPFRRLQYSKLRAHFHMYTDMQIRQKLKEFAVYYKKGENTGWWKIKPNLVLPDEDGIRNIYTPEMVCLHHSTVVGAQRLKDAGYGIDDFKEVEDDEDNNNESHLDIEVQLAPWTTTKNFLTAATGKGMVALFGPGDPTGCQQGFSFFRASMKEMFYHHEEQMRAEEENKPIYHKYSIAEQQKVYKAEIERIWENQSRGLSGLEKRAEVEGVELAVLSSVERVERESEDEESEKVASESSRRRDEGEEEEKESKMLIINRLCKVENVWKSEVITDSRVLTAYLKHRKMIEAPPTALSARPNETDFKVRFKRRLNAHIVKLQIKQGKRPPLNEEEDLSESELPDSSFKPQTITIKLDKDKSYKRDAEEMLEVENKRRLMLKPEDEFRNLLLSILDVVIQAPQYSPLIQPHSSPYIHTPTTLSLIKQNLLNNSYKTHQSFLQEFGLLSDNCALEYGVGHMMTLISGQLRMVVAVMVEERKADLVRLEEILGVYYVEPVQLDFSF